MEGTNLDERVKILEEKVSKLEKIENKRKTLKWIKIGFKLMFYIGIILIIYLGYRYIKVNYLEPYDTWKNNIQTNIDTLKNWKSLFNY